MGGLGARGGESREILFWVRYRVRKLKSGRVSRDRFSAPIT